MSMKIIFLFLFGAFVGTLLDLLQTFNGIATYTNPLIFRTAWWVPFLFGGGAVLIGLGHSKMSPVSTTKKTFLKFLSLLILASLVTAFFKIPNTQKAAALLILFFVGWFLWDRNPKNILLALCVAVVGSAIESSLARIGLYFYTQPDMCGIPYWLPCLYFHVSQAAGLLGRLLLMETHK